MSLISFSNVSKYFGSDLLLDHISFAINEKEKVALIGENGAGKTTIFKMILGEEPATLLSKEDKPGDISILGGTTIGYLNQNAITNINNTVYEELILAFKKTLEIEKRIEKYSTLDLSNQDNLEKYNKLLEEYEANRGYTYKNEIKEMVSRFSFPLEILDRQVKSLSGGERMKIAFIKILLFNYDVLLLDEPTNHLDISTIEWLENFLKSYNGTIVFISHDTYFLQTLATKIIDLENKVTTTYNTNYDTFLKMKEENYNNLVAQAKREDAEIERYKRMIAFLKPKPRFVSRAKDKEKKLAKLEKNHVEVQQKKEKNIKINLDGGNIASRQLLEFSHVEVGYDYPLIKPFSFILYGQDRLGIVGDNGIGKTTLIKTIIKEIPCFKGSIKELRKIKFGYIKQNDYEFKSNLNALEFMEEKHPTFIEKELRNILGKFFFRADEVYKSVNLMSNGEKMRLLLASLSLDSYDILLLDEPTNHLDLATKNSLIDSLSDYKGALIFISHDRYFINQLASRILYLSKDNSIFLEGNYDDLKETLNKLTPEIEDNKNEIIKEKAPVNTSTSKLSKNKLAELQNTASSLEKQIKIIEAKLIDENTPYTELDNLNEEKSSLEEKYLEVLEILDNSL